uniref:BTB domain-containing protein n=1 Tax=Ascaris lumbricoides TaxID=6252 RepID=A0A0M3HXY5_ASCLU
MNFFSGKCVRRVVSAFPSGISIDGRVQLIIECKEVQDADHCNLHPCLLTALPSDRELKVSLFSFFVPEDIRAMNVANILNFNIDEAEWLYQCLYVTYFSRHVDLIPSQALAALHRLGTFTDVDFGDWQLSVGEVGTRWQGISFYCTLSHLDSLPSGCRIFTR